MSAIPTMLQNLIQIGCHIDSKPVCIWRRFGVAVTRWSRSTRLTYAEPGGTGMDDRPGSTPGAALYFGM